MPRKVPASPEEVVAGDEFKQPEVRKRDVYRVVGPHVVHDTAPGEEVELSLTQGELASLIGAGHIVSVTQERL